MSTLSMSAVNTQSMDAPWAGFGPSASVAFVVCATVLATIAFPSPLNESWMRSTMASYDNTDAMESAVQEGSFGREIALCSLGLFGLAALAWRGGKELSAWKLVTVFLVTYLAWCASSIIWSDDSSVSLRRFIALCCELAAGLAIAKRASPRQFVWIVFACTLSWLSLGVLAELSLGTFRPGQADYRFAGIFHPNEMGIGCGLLAATAMYLGRGAQRAKPLFFAIAGLALAFLVLTASRNALLATVAAIAAWWFVTAPPSRKIATILGFGLAAGVAGMVISLGAFDFISNAIAMGRDDSDMSSFTGRIPLWEDLLDNYVSQSPLIGYGYGAFWSADHIAEISKSQTWPVASTHSAYVDLLLNVGCIGAILCLSTLLLACVRASRMECQRPNAGYGVIVIILVLGLVGGVFETTLGNTWYLSFFSICSVCLLMFSDAQNVGLKSSDSESMQSIPHLAVSRRNSMS